MVIVNYDPGSNRQIFGQPKLTHDVQEAYLIAHRVGIDLAHVPALVRLFDVLYTQHPLAALDVRYRHPVVLGDHVRLNRQNRLRVHPQPGDLWREDN